MGKNSWEMGAKRLFIIAMFLVVVGGLNWGVQAATGKDLVSRLVGKRAWIVYGLVALAALYIGFARDTYLPFLGETVMPCSLLSDHTPEGADTEVQVHVKPGAKVLFWATEPSTEDLKEIQDWRHAYLGFKNAGVTTADSSGMAVLRVRTPQPYTVGAFNQKKLSPHVHYRVCKNAGMLDRVETVFVEAFANQRDYAASAEEERRLGMAGLQADAASSQLEPFANVDAEGAEGAEGAEDAEGAEEEENPVQDEGFMNQYAYPVVYPASAKLPSSNETFAMEEASAHFNSDFMIPTTMRDRKVDMPLYSIAEETEKNRIVDVNGIDESPSHLGTDLTQAY